MLFLFFSCSKSVTLISTFSLSSQETLEGKIWWELEIRENSSFKKDAGYADFQINENFLYLRLKTPIGTTLGFLIWKKDQPTVIKVYDLYNQQYIKIHLKSMTTKELETFPFYFLGKKGEEKSWYLNNLLFKYKFDKSKNKGNIVSEIMFLEWKIYTLQSLEGKTWEALFNFESLEKQFVKKELIF